MFKLLDHILQYSSRLAFSQLTLKVEIDGVQIEKL